jgi:hypothetical protein
VGLTFEWDTRKAARNLRIRQVSFEEASTVFDDPLSATVSDPDHSEEEDMKKSDLEAKDELRPEYDMTQLLKTAVRGKYVERYR